MQSGSEQKVNNLNHAFCAEQLDMFSALSLVSGDCKLSFEYFSCTFVIIKLVATRCADAAAAVF